jgi:hypothetical protein
MMSGGLTRVPCVAHRWSSGRVTVLAASSECSPAVGQAGALSCNGWQVYRYGIVHACAPRAGTSLLQESRAEEA